MAKERSPVNAGAVNSLGGQEPSFALRTPQMTILPDHPILHDTDRDDDRERDAFDLEASLGSVYDIIRHRNTVAPMAVGIFGDWGTGKSSAMRWLWDQLEAWSRGGHNRHGHLRCRCVWFEPWKYQKREEVWRGLIAEVIIHSIDVENATPDTVVSAAKKFGAFLGRGFVHALSSIKVKGEAGGAAGSPKVGAEVDFEAIAKIVEDYKRTAHPEKAYLNEFESTLKEWVKGSLGKDDRLVLFIDDLDRCLPGVVLEVLEALKLYLNIPSLIFVVGLDRDVVRAIIRRHYEDAGLDGVKAESYLDKMFQVEVEIAPSERRMDDYVTKQLANLDKSTDGYWNRQFSGTEGGKRRAVIEGVIKQLAAHNPREIKRLLNSTLMHGAAARRSKAENQDAALRFAQGCQTWLTHRVVRDKRTLFPGVSAILREEKTGQFFEKWSQFIKEHPGFRPDSAAKSGGMSFGSEATGNKAANDAYRALQEHLPRRKDKVEAFPFLEEDLLWTLMQFPASADVWQMASARAAEDATLKRDISAVPKVNFRQKAAGLDLAEMEADSKGWGPNGKPDLPLIVWSRIAKSLDKDPDSLTLADMTRVTKLDLSRTEVDDDALTALANHKTGLIALEALDLGITKVTDSGLEALAGPESGIGSLSRIVLSIDKRSITDKGISSLRKRWPDIVIEEWEF